MPKRTSVVERTPVRFVLLTMDRHLAGASDRAAEWVARDVPGFEFSLHAASDWHEDADALARCKADLERADIIVATMLFMEEHYTPVIEILRRRRESVMAMVCALCAGEVTRLTRMGRFSMEGGSSGPLAFLKRLRGSRSQGSGAGEQQLRMLKRIPRLLRFIPGTAQDVRAYFLTLQYWLAGSEENIANLLRFLVQRYAPAAASRKGAPRAADPVDYPEVGLFHPALADRFTTESRALPAGPRAASGTVGLLLMRSYLLAGNTRHYEGVINALESRGLRVIPAFASGLDARPAIERFFLDANGSSLVDTVVSLTGFSLVGGPAYNDARAAEEILERLDVPYLSVTPVEFQSLDQWEDNPQGLLPVEATMMISLPELDGSIVPMVFGGRRTGGRGAHESTRHEMQVHAERAQMLAARVERLVRLRRKQNTDKRIAVVLFNFPPHSGNTGTAAHLAVFESLFNLLVSMRDDGYSVEVPADVDALRAQIIVGNAERYGTYANVHARIPTNDHVRRERWLGEIEQQWGPAPGRLQTDGSSLFVLGAQFGNVFVGIQPSMGYEGDPMRLLFEKGFAPTHAFAAFYTWMREDFSADAVLHFGTHGALEFMPGKQAGMSERCWPDRLIRDLPNLYLYASNNPSEGTVAKRRAGATLVSYLTPPVTEAGTYRELSDLKATLERWRELPPEQGEERAQLVSIIEAQASALSLADAGHWDQTQTEENIARLQLSLRELEETLIPCGLHVMGEAMPREACLDFLCAMAVATTGTSLTRGEAEALYDHAQLPAGREDLTALLGAVSHLRTDAEIPALLRAMSARYIRPVTGADVLRSPEVLPTGRNLHGFDPFRIPSAHALITGRQQAEQLLARHQSDGAGLPESIAMVLWGTDNLKTEGGPIAQVLALIGAAPRFDGYGRLAGASLLPLETLGRPRLDVVVTLSGIFRDLLPLQTRLLAEAFFLAASADEPIEANFVRKHALAYQASHGVDLETAALRVFSNADGAYGANVNLMVDNGRWEDEDELAELFSRRKSFAYGRDGRPQAQPELLDKVLANVEVAFQNLDSVELGITTIDQYFDTLGGISRAVGRARGTAPQVYVGDHTRGDGAVRTLAEQVALETRTRVLNPKWHEGMLQHGYEGVRQIESALTNTLGWSATTGQVAPWIYQQITETFVKDPAMYERLASLNLAATAKVANRLLEAYQRQYWEPDAETLQALQRASEDLEDRLEGICQEVAA